MKAILSWWSNEGALTTLRSLDDRMLADMGLTRVDLKARVAGEKPAATPVSAGREACAGCCEAAT